MLRIKFAYFVYYDIAFNDDRLVIKQMAMNGDEMFPPESFSVSIVVASLERTSYAAEFIAAAPHMLLPHISLFDCMLAAGAMDPIP